MSTLTKNMRIIDLTLDQLDVLLEEKLSKFQNSVNPKNDRVGDYDLACEITGYSKQRLYQLVSEEIIPFVKLPSGGVRFFEEDLLDWFKKYKNKSESDVSEVAQTMLMKRKMRRKN